MELKLHIFLVKVLFLCVIVRSNVPAQANQGAQNSNEQSSSYFFYERSEYPRDCTEIQQQCSAQNSSRVHLIQPDGVLEPSIVYCEDEWTVIQRREHSFIDFNRNWTEISDGFGFLYSDFWIGNQKLAYLTNQKQNELMITFETVTGDSYHVTYSMFRISDKFSNYTIVSVGQFTGTLQGLLFTIPPTDCYDLQQAGDTTSGDYTVDPAGWSGGPFTINCNMDIDEGGWTVFQRRIDGTEGFNLGWDSYKEGFGTPRGEFWMGNDKLAFLTNQKDYELRIDLINVNLAPYYAKYDLFRITDESNKYRLVGLGNYSGNAGYDSLRNHYFQAFSTIDQDNDVDLENAGGCAALYQSAWWYNNCYHSDLNSQYTGRYPIFWSNLPGGSSNITYTEMKIRPV